jgi:putative hydrolase of the HAD superfamily
MTFDVVGTLIDFEGGMLAYRSQDRPARDVSDDAFLGAYRDARKNAGSTGIPDDLERCWHVGRAGLGLPDSDTLARGLRDSVADWPAFPDSVAALHACGSTSSS